MRRPAVLAAALLAATGALIAAPAQGASESREAIGLAYDTDGGFGHEITTTVFLDPVIVPGDTGARELYVRNLGEIDGVLSATIVNVSLGGDPDDPFYDELTINGRAVSTLEGHETLLLDRPLSAGRSACVDLAYDFPRDASAGSAAEQQLSVSFDVRLRLSEAVPSGGGGPGGGGGSAATTDPGGTAAGGAGAYADGSGTGSGANAAVTPGAAPTGPSWLPRTGADPGVLAALAAVLLTVGAALAGAARRLRRSG